MPTDNFSTGRDLTLTIVTPEVGPLTFNLITAFTAKPITDTQSPMGIDGIPRHVVFLKGWQGSLMIERQDSTFDDYFAVQEGNYWAGVAQQTASITETIAEQAGNVTQWRYTQVLLIPDDMGEYRGDATVKQSLHFLASKRLKIA